MANDVNLKAFPSSCEDALAMLFLQNQDLRGKSPEELAAMYHDALQRINAKLDALCKEGKPHRSFI